MKSMTGYGRGDSILYDRKFTVEIKSVNHRYNDISIKLPRVLNAFEDKIKSRLASEISRGKTDVYIHLESFSAADIKISINKPLADAYADAVVQLRDRYSLQDDLALSLLAKFPDIINVEKLGNDEENMSQLWEALQYALSDAVTQFMSMRALEGAKLKEDILVKRETVLALAHKVKQRAPLVAKEYAERLKAKVEEALGIGGVNYDEIRLIQEITIFSDKSCIDEELTRLESHLAQLLEIVSEEDAVGKKLDFLVQEINREINTIGSKSNDIEITKTVVQMKSEVEKIREQVQNIE